MTDQDQVFADGDVVRYIPQAQYPGQRDTRWCREGTAIAETRRDGSLMLVDTFWGGMGSDSHVLTDAELQTAELRFRLTDYDELDQYDRRVSLRWEKFAPSDRERVTSQHGLQARWFVRKGASESLATQIDNARARLDEAQEKLRSAEYGVELRRHDLAELQAAEWGVAVTDQSPVSPVTDEPLSDWLLALFANHAVDSDVQAMARELRAARTRQAAVEALCDEVERQAKSVRASGDQSITPIAELELIDRIRAAAAVPTEGNPE